MLQQINSFHWYYKVTPLLSDNLIYIAQCCSVNILAVNKSVFKSINIKMKYLTFICNTGDPSNSSY